MKINCFYPLTSSVDIVKIAKLRGTMHAWAYTDRTFCLNLIYPNIATDIAIAIIISIHTYKFARDISPEI